MKFTKLSATAIAESAIKASQREREAWKLAYNEPDKIPTGWRNTEEWAALWSKAVPSARVLVGKLVRKKLMEMKSFRLMNSDGRVRPCPHYKLL